MKPLLYFFCFLLSFSVGLSAAEVQKTQDDKEEELLPYTVKTQEGLIFRVPEDMPIEKRGGIIAPIPFDEYMYRKLKLINDELTDVKKRLEKIEQGQGGEPIDKKKLVS